MSFTRFAETTSRLAGRPITFLLAVAAVVVWAALGPVFLYSDDWQMVINTGTTIITFLMVFVIQASQNHDTAALHVKLNELIRAVEGADNKIAAVDKMEAKELEELREDGRRKAAEGSSGEEL